MQSTCCLKKILYHSYWQTCTFCTSQFFEQVAVIYAQAGWPLSWMKKILTRKFCFWAFCCTMKQHQLPSAWQEVQQPSTGRAVRLRLEIWDMSSSQRVASSKSEKTFHPQSPTGSNADSFYFLPKLEASVGRTVGPPLSRPKYLSNWVHPCYSEVLSCWIGW